MHRKFVRVLFPIQLWCIVAGACVKAQGLSNDTLSIGIKEAETQFLTKNLTLLAQHYNIDNASAQVITARLFPNPDFNFENGIYNNTHNAYRNQSAGLSQLFTTAGKRNKNIQLANLGVEQAKYQFFDLLRTLRFTLRNDFYNIYFQQQSAKVYNEEIDALTKTVTAYREQYSKGNISQKELLRVQSQLYALRNEYNGLQQGIDTLQSEFKMLIRAAPGVTVVPRLDWKEAINQSVAAVPYASYLDSAYTNRNDLKYARSVVDYNNLNLQLQKAIAKPDVSFSLSYDKFGSFNQNYLGGGVEFNLPFFNRNQGNIKQAQIAIEQGKLGLQNQQDQIANDLFTGYKSALRAEQLYKDLDPSFNQDFGHLVHEVLKNYQRKNISLLEFLDFYEAYKNNVLQFNGLLFNRLSSLEQINYITASSFFNR
ncbi:TolC family protein [Mucilaginibacter sp. RS28]|uniref:TolC family protein n=1 Tax=Mucilaginibacter straminoryzae TaxID=2932774 RepID=A0A9X1X5B0_9SPHI|nr:TolC family protein [Mucilaginibacter straminoryzae]MCJ8210340.1 TolC family protein [Mucilaginibacter straminoryzae]